MLSACLMHTLRSVRNLRIDPKTEIHNPVSAIHSSLLSLQLISCS
jgi:hypothetical protein